MRRFFAIGLVLVVGVLAAAQSSIAGSGLPGDTDGDGDVDLADLDQFGMEFEGGPATIGWPSDFDCDGDVDLLDLDILGANWGAGTASAVPEPGSAGLAISLATLAAGRRRRRSGGRGTTC